MLFAMHTFSCWHNGCLHVSVDVQMEFNSWVNAAMEIVDDASATLTGKLLTLGDESGMVCSKHTAATT